MRVAALAAVALVSLASAARPSRPTPLPQSTSARRSGVRAGAGAPLASRTGPGLVDGSAAAASANRPSLIDYVPVANAGAVVVSSDGKARFTVSEPRSCGSVPSRNARGAVPTRAPPPPRRF